MLHLTPIKRISTTDEQSSDDYDADDDNDINEDEDEKLILEVLLSHELYFRSDPKYTRSLLVGMLRVSSTDFIAIRYMVLTRMFDYDIILSTHSSMKL